MENKKLGVLGGMGPFATSVFLDRVISNTLATKDQEHIDTVVLNHASLPDRTEAIIHQRGQAFLQAIQSDIELLEYSGVSNIAIPCNTSHYFYDDMQAMTNVNIINMVESTVNHVHSQYGAGSKVAVLATNGTMQSRIYEKELEKQGLNFCPLSSDIQQEIMGIIYAVKSDEEFQSDELSRIMHDLITREGCACVVLACTELSCLNIDDSLRKYYVDALDVLVNQSILLSGKNVKQPVIWG